MAKQIIGVGASANDGTGDTLRAAMQKVNANFTELYSGIRSDPIVGRWYSPVPTGSQGGSAIPANTIIFQPFVVAKAITVSDLGVLVTTAQAAGNVQVAIYADGGAAKPTGNALAVTASMTTAVVTGVQADITGANVALAPGLYWMAVNQDNSSSAFSTVGAALHHFSYLVGGSTLNDLFGAATSYAMRLTLAQTFGTWPDVTASSFTLSTGSVASAIVYMKVA